MIKFADLKFMTTIQLAISMVGIISILKQRTDQESKVRRTEKRFTALDAA